MRRKRKLRCTVESSSMLGVSGEFPDSRRAFSCRETARQRRKKEAALNYSGGLPSNFVC